MPISSLSTYWHLQAVDTTGGTHPTGWASGQLYSATSAQWQNMYNAEVTLYNNEVAAYNDMLSQRNTWQGRANSAWGASRVWSSGESWEAAYTRVYTDRYNQGYADGRAAFQSPSSTPLTLDSGAFSYINDTGYGNWTNGVSFTVNHTGYWHVYYRGIVDTFVSGARTGYRVLVNGSLGDGGDGTAASLAGLSWVGILTNGMTVQFQYWADLQGYGGQVSGHLYATFLSTQTYPN